MYIFDFITKECSDIVRIIDEMEKRQIIDNITEKFLDVKIVEQQILLWNSLKEEYKKYKRIISLNQMNEITIPNRKNIYIYLDRNKKLFQGS